MRPEIRAMLDQAHRYEFSYGGSKIVFAPSRQRLDVDGETRHIEPLVQQILCLLLWSPREIVDLKILAGTQDNIASVNNALTKLRKALDPYGSLIRNVRAKGHRFEGDIDRRTVQSSQKQSRFAPQQQIGEFVLTEQLSNNSGVEVWRGRDAGDATCIVKMAADGRENRVIQREGSFWTLLDKELPASPHFPQLINVFVEAEPNHLVLEDRGQNLAQWMENVERVDSETQRSIMLHLMSAMSALHDLGILHRDLKPSNILIRQLEDDVQVSLIDFGSARHLRHQRFEELDVRALGMTLRDNDPYDSEIGTLFHSAPEVLAGQEGSPASDVYSLATLLLQLESGAINRKTAWTTWESEVPDLAIRELLRKALQADPDRRTRSIAEFRQGYLNIDTRRREIQALAAYERQQQLKPWRIGLATVLVCATAVTSIMAYQASRAREAIRLEQQRSSEVIDFMIGTLKPADPRQAINNPDPSLLSSLQNASRLLDSETPADPAVRKQLSDVLEEIYGGLRNKAAQIAETERGIELSSQLDGSDSSETLARRYALAETLAMHEQTDAAVETLAALESATARVSEDRILLKFLDRYTRGRIALHGLDYPKALAYFEETEKLYRPEAPGFDVNRVTFLISHAQTLARLGEYEPALERLDTLLNSESLSVEAWKRLDAQLLQAQIYGFMGQPRESIRTIEDVLPQLKAMYGPNGFKVATALTELGQSYNSLGNPKASYDTYGEASRIFCDEKTGALNHCVISSGNQSITALMLDKNDALDLLLSVQDRIESLSPDNPVMTSFFRFWIAHAYLNHNDVNLARDFRDGLEAKYLEMAAPGSDWGKRLAALDTRINIYEGSAGDVATLREQLQYFVSKDAEDNELRVMGRVPGGFAVGPRHE